MRAKDWPCRRCSHPASWHRLDDSKNISPNDPAAQFRCINYDCEAPGPVPHGGCGCPDFVESTGYLAAIEIELGA